MPRTQKERLVLPAELQEGDVIRQPGSYFMDAQIRHCQFSDTSGNLGVITTRGDKFFINPLQQVVLVRRTCRRPAGTSSVTVNSPVRKTGHLRLVTP